MADEIMSRKEIAARLRAVANHTEPWKLNDDSKVAWRVACRQAADHFDALDSVSLASPEDGTPSGYAVMNSQGKLHSLTLFQEVAEHNAKTLNQTVVPLYRKASPTPQNGQS